MPQSVVGCSSLFDFKPESCGKERGNLGYLMDVAKQVFLQWAISAFTLRFGCFPVIIINCCIGMCWFDFATACVCVRGGGGGGVLKKLFRYIL